MRNHYGRLFRYKASPDRSPLEDFLSEALADLMARIPLEELSELLGHAFAGVEHPDFGGLLAKGALRWDTQVPVSGGIADIVLSVADKPVLLIENKTWSGFQDHSTDDQEANQLTTYCAWLATKAAAGESAVLLLSGTTASPVGYHDPDGSYAVASRAQMTWAALGRWLRAHCDSGTIDAAPPATWQSLAMELVAFLEEKKLSSEIYDATDVSAAHLFVPTMDRWLATFDSLWSGTGETWSSYLGSRLSEVRIDSEGAMIWQWRYALDGVAPIRSYIGLGIRFPDMSEWYQGLGLPDTPHFLFLIATDRGRLRLSGELPDEWIYNDDEAEFLAWKPLNDLDASPDKRIDQLRGWGASRLREAELILRECQAD